MSEIEDLRVERLPEVADKQLAAKKLLKVIILGDTGKFMGPKSIVPPAIIWPLIVMFSPYIGSSIFV